MDSSVIAIEIANANTDVQLLDKPCTFYGFTGQGAAVATKIYIRDGSATGKIVAIMSIAATGAMNPCFFPKGVRINSSLWIDRDGTNNFEGAAYVG
jgi:hypothetical protein